MKNNNLIVNAETEQKEINTDMLFLKRSEIASLITLQEYITAMEDAFKMHSLGRSMKPALMHVDADRGEYHVKGGGLKLDKPYFALKANGSFFSNKNDYGLPNIIGLITLFDGDCGRPLAVMDSIDITFMRTGATTAVAAKYLARTDSKTVTICGCGTQGRIQLEALLNIFPNIEKVYAWDNKLQNAERFKSDMQMKLGKEIIAVEKIKDAAIESDIIITCTPSKEYYLNKEYIRPGTFISAVGADSPTKQELDPKLIANSTLVVDILEQCKMAGELHHALEAGLMDISEVHGMLGDVLTGKIKGRTSSDEVIIFDTTGSAIQDTAAAVLAYKKALAQKYGTWLNPYE